MLDQDIFDYLREIGCCVMCCLRFFKARGDEYEDAKKTLQERGIKLMAEETTTPPLEETEPAPKKPKSNVCIACLGFFSDEFLEHLTTSLSSHPDIVEYDSTEFVLAITLPILLNVRQLSIWLALIDKFGTTPGFNKEKIPDVPLKEASKLVVVPRVAKLLNKTYGQNGIMINVAIQHADEAAELKNVGEVDAILFRPNGKSKNKRRHKKGVLEGITRAYFERNFQPTSINLKVYKEHIAVPPEALSSPLAVGKVSVVGPTIFAAGRYQKFSRELPHSPWILNGKRIMEDSIQEIIIRSVAPHFRVPNEKIVFSSSGREDVDVRCLGTGRPFVLEIPDAKRTTLPQSIAEQMELEIERSGKINIINLQIVPREELVHIKTGEEKKRKTYRALATLKTPATVEIMKKLNKPEGFEIKQWTPIRVLHRRAVLERTRMIYSLKAYVVPTDLTLLVLDIVSQAGTYIKELVHGDFDRTVPSLSRMVGQDMDIVALDVMAIDLDWPKDINNRISVKNEGSSVQIEASVTKSKDGITQSQESITESEDGITKSGEGIIKSEESVTKSEDGITKNTDSVNKKEDSSLKSEEGSIKIEDSNTKPETNKIENEVNDVEMENDDQNKC